MVSLVDEASRWIWATVRAGLLVPLDARENVGNGTATASFRFAHDRIRQAAYLLLGEEARKRTHSRSGTSCFTTPATSSALDERIYAIVDQIDRGLELVTAPEERLRLSRLNVRAAHKARGSSAYGPALDYLKCAIALLPDDAWRSHPRETFSLYREAVQLAGFAADLTVVDDLFRRALARAESPVDKADLYNLRMYASIAQTRPRRGLSIRAQGPAAPRHRAAAGRSRAGHGAGAGGAPSEPQRPDPGRPAGGAPDVGARASRQHGPSQPPSPM